jgi:DNA-binding MarR family transcriptional regulator
MKRKNYISDMTPDEKVLMAIVKAGEIFKRAVSTVFRNHGLSFPQYNVLRVLDAYQEGPVKISDVSRIMLVAGANMTGVAKRLEKSGFIIRKADANDERVTILEITPKGVETLRAIEKERHECDRAMLEGFSENDKSELMTKVRQLLNNSIQLSVNPTPRDDLDV